jgi:hypothetical protein
VPIDQKVEDNQRRNQQQRQKIEERQPCAQTDGDDTGEA